MKKISGVILAGGASSRFGGKTKSNMMVGGISIISRMVNTLSEVFKEIIIVTNKPEEFRDFRKYKIVSDEYKNVGPLGGIHAAMKVSSNPAIFVFGGDMPFITKDLIESQIEYYKHNSCDVLLPRNDSYDEPLHAIYSLNSFIKLDYYLLMAEKYAIKDFLDKVEVSYFNPGKSVSNDMVFTNINTPVDLTGADRYLTKNSLLKSK